MRAGSSLLSFPFLCPILTQRVTQGGKKSEVLQTQCASSLQRGVLPACSFLGGKPSR